MKTICNLGQFNAQAKEGGVMPSYWLVINSLHSDRKQEIVGSTEDWNG
jgi:hypothetical protein